MDRDQMQAHLILHGWRPAKVASANEASGIANEEGVFLCVDIHGGVNKILPVPRRAGRTWESIPDCNFWMLAKAAARLDQITAMHFSQYDLERMSQWLGEP